MKKTRLFSMLSVLAVSATMLTTNLTANAANMSSADNGVLVTSDTSLTFTKDIVVHNEENVASIYGPTITYNYSIAPYEVTNADTITDSAGKTVKAKTGITGGVSLTDNTAVFTSTEPIELENGKKVISDNLVAAVDLTKFEAAGVYRYKITETPEAGGLAAADIIRDTDNYSADRYLDVYIKNGDSGLEVSAFVMFHKGESETMTIDGQDTNTTLKKTTGYDSGDNNGSGSSGSDDGNMADKYYTYNYTVKKNITGTLADKKHEFPFTVKTTASSKAGQNFFVKKNDADAPLGTIGTDVKPGLADGDTLKLIGLPASATVAVSETNDTIDSYKGSAVKPAITATLLDGDNKTIGFNATALTDYTSSSKDEPTKNADITGTEFTNALEEMSPTGVILTYIPYAIMLGAALLFIALFIRNKKKDEYENTI
ncbi:MAG: hypothetical protein IJJ57_06680 [Ruminococcus sp.]|nr:hypothetical protein [Ruminococcus sp.]